MMYERTAISRLAEATIGQDLPLLRDADRLTPELVFGDPYLLDFLGLRDAYSERDLEAAILQEFEFHSGTNDLASRPQSLKGRSNHPLVMKLWY